MKKWIFYLPAALAFLACDMEYLNPAPSFKNQELTMETEGHYLKLINMPQDTQVKNVKSCVIANSNGSIAKIDPSKGISVFKQNNSANVYINLVYNDNSPFVENGYFYVELSVYIDALTWIEIPVKANVVVRFTEGRGVLDALSLKPGETISPDWPVTEPEDKQKERELETAGHYLKLINMPSNTLPGNLKSISIADAGRNVAKLDTKRGVQVFQQTQTASVYINLQDNSGNDFLATGPFYVVLSVYIDALTWIEIPVKAKVTVAFEEGRGTLDVLSLLPGDTISPNWPVVNPEPGSEPTPQEIAELERNGHYILLYHLPAGTQKENITELFVSDGNTTIAQADKKTPPLIVRDKNHVNVYAHLKASNGDNFTRTGNFIVSFTVHIDALTKITLRRQDNVIVMFNEGRGELDLESLVKSYPGVVEQTPDAEIENGINTIISNGSYIRFFNLPRNSSKNSFSAITVATAQSTLARPRDYEAIIVRKNVLDAEAFVPIVSTRNGDNFEETGFYFVSFSINIDVVTQIIVLPSYALSYSFSQGISEIDMNFVPTAPAKPPAIPHSLVIGGLPTTTGAPNIAETVIHNAAGVVAKCPDYTKIYMTSFDSKMAAVIPLVYDNNKAFNGRDFADSGNLLVTFTIYPDAEHIISVTLDNNCLVYFQSGCAYLDISNVPPVPRHTLTITNLPANTQATDIEKVFISNQSGKIAECQSYSLIETKESNNTITIRIPLVYSNNKSIIFGETGPYIVSFDLNIDALTRVLITEADNVTAYFTTGNATLDAATLPIALPVPYLTILGLPLNTAKGNFQDVFLYNAAGKIAQCADYNAVMISKGNESATAMIPLVYTADKKQYFRDSGSFVVTFNINIDYNTQIIQSYADLLLVQFQNGSGEYNIKDFLGYFSCELVNPDDTAPPIIKIGSVFELEGGVVKLTKDTPVNPPSPPLTSTSIAYLYASKSQGITKFELSTITPIWDEAKKGFYNRSKRALYKTIYLKDTVEKCVSKTYIADNWRVSTQVIDNLNLSNIENKRIYSLIGSNNPKPQTYTAQKGIYIFALAGAGGGGGGGIDGIGDRNHYGGAGGEGGFVAELIFVEDQTQTFTAFTGSGGYGSAYTSYGTYQGTGGGGGGSGAFIHSENYSYFLCAGGGGGGGGAGANDGTGGGGGAGGCISGGGGGGGGGSASNGQQPGTSGGKGGGYLGGANGTGGLNRNGTSGQTPQAIFPIYNQNGYNGNPDWGADDGGKHGGPGGAAPYYKMAGDLLNTEGVPGTGGTGITYGWGHPGGAGGNNRNGERGGGGEGGAGGWPADGPGSAGIQGSYGYIYIYKID
jgi:hypothetical protein